MKGQDCLEPHGPSWVPPPVLCSLNFTNEEGVGLKFKELALRSTAGSYGTANYLPYKQESGAPTWLQLGGIQLEKGSP